MKVSTNQYTQLMYDLEKNSSEKDLKNNLRQLALFIHKNKDLKKLNKIFKKYQELKKEKEKTKDVILITREKISDEKTKEIKKVISEKIMMSSNKINVSNKIDENIISGITIKIGNQIWDGSLKTKLEKIKSVLLS